MATKFWISTSSTSFSTAANWSDNAAPSNNDTLIFNGAGTANCSTDLSSTLTGVTVIVEASYLGRIGNVSGGTTSYLVLDGGTLKMPRAMGGTGSGPDRVMIDFGTTAATIVIEQSPSRAAEDAYPPVMLKGTALTAIISGGGRGVGFAVRPGETATLASLKTMAGVGGTPTVYLGDGVTLTDAVLDAGVVYSRANNTATAVRLGGATYSVAGGATGAHTTINLDDGKLIYNGTGTITTLNLKGIADFSGNSQSKTVTTANTYKGSSLILDNGAPGSIVFTNAINHYDGIGTRGCTLITPASVKGTLVAI